MKIAKKYVIVIALTLFTILLSSCGSSYVNKVISSLDEENYEEARRIYQEKIAVDYDRKQELFVKLEERVNNAISDYNSGKISESEAYSVLNSLQLSELLDKTGINIDEKYELLDDLVYSKNFYSCGIASLSDQEYLSAYFQLGQVCPEDTNYQDAQERMIEAENAFESQVIAEYELFSQQHDYKSAVYTLNEALGSFPDNPTFTTALNELFGDWQAYTLSEAAACFANGNDYQGAIMILQQSGLTGEVIDNEIARYQAYIPVSLTSLEYTQKTEHITVGTRYDSISMDVNRDIYPSDSVIYPNAVPNLFTTHFAETEDESYVIYYLNGEFSNLSGKVYRPYITLTSSLPWDNVWDIPTVVRIYGDGVLLYDAPHITKDTYDVYTIDIDVTGVRELKIVMLGVWYEEDTRAKPKVCISDLYLRK